VSVEVLLESGISVCHVAVAMVTAVQDLDIATTYLTETETMPPPHPFPTFKWQYYLAHIAQIVVFCSVWSLRKLIKHLGDTKHHISVITVL